MEKQSCSQVPRQVSPASPGSVTIVTTLPLRQVENQKCTEIPREVARQECVTVPRQVCVNVPKQVEKEICNKIPRFDNMKRM